MPIHLSNGVTDYPFCTPVVRHHRLVVYIGTKGLRFPEKFNLIFEENVISCCMNVANIIVLSL